MEEAEEGAMAARESLRNSGFNEYDNLIDDIPPPPQLQPPPPPLISSPSSVDEEVEDKSDFVQNNPLAHLDDDEGDHPTTHAVLHRRNTIEPPPVSHHSVTSYFINGSVNS